MATLQQSRPKAGWYRDPYHAGRLRWWDGRGWTSYVATPRATRRRQGSGIIATVAAVVVVVAMTLSSGLLPRLQQLGELVLVPPAPAAPAAPRDPAPAAADLEQAIAAAVMVRADCGPGCSTVGGAVPVGETTLLTAAHVAPAGGTVVIIDATGSALLAQVVSADPRTDLALLHTGSPHGLAAVEVRSDPPVVGEAATAVGYPGGIRRVSSGSVTGVLDVERDGVVDVRTDADIDVGNSGGPLLDAGGRLLGIVVKEHETDDSIAWATAASEIDGFLRAAEQSPLPDPLLPGSEGYDDMLSDMFRRSRD